MKVGLQSGRAFYRFSQGRYAEALIILENVLHLFREGDPDSKYIHSMLGRFYLHEGRMPEARRELEKAFQLYATCPRNKWRNKDETAFKETAQAYGQLLRHFGQSDLAVEVEQAPMTKKS